MYNDSRLSNIGEFVMVSLDNKVSNLKHNDGVNNNIKDADDNFNAI